MSDNNALVDIVIPVWNRPVETRAALASYVASSPFARLVMVNSGSERETERILDEFAEALDDRAILLATERNVGRIAAINLGISRADSRFILLADCSVNLVSGWFDPLLNYLQDNPQVGAVTLGSSAETIMEADHGSFDAMLVRKELFSAVGSFDEAYDTFVWGLRDFARRALQAGFLTAAAPDRGVKRIAIPELGSESRRNERFQLAAARYTGKWGEATSLLLQCNDEIPGGDIDSFRELLLAFARRGDKLTVSAGGRGGKLLKSAGFASLHENINFSVLPMLFKGDALRKLAAALVSQDNKVYLVTDDNRFQLSMETVDFDTFAKRSDIRPSKELC